MGKYRRCPSLKSLSSRIEGTLCNCGPSNNYKKLDSKLERKMIEIKRSASGQYNFKSIDRIILRFPQFRDGLRNLRSVFEQYDEDSNGTIDREELNKCLEKLQLRLTKEEVEDLFRSCDIDRSGGIQFDEFIVLLCLIYLLMKPSSSPDNVSTVNIFLTLKMDSPQLEATFDTIVEAFLFLDKNGDGKLNKKDMMKALNEASNGNDPLHMSAGLDSKKWIGIRMGRSASESSSLLLSTGLGLKAMKKHLTREANSTRQ